MSKETSTPQGPQGPQGPEEKVSVSWLILQRLDDLKSQIADVKQDVKQLREHVDGRFEGFDRRFEGFDRHLEGLLRLWTWTVGLIAAVVLSAIVKLFVPGA